MSRRLLSFVGGAVLALTTAGTALAQQPTTTTTTTTTQTTAVQNADGSWTVVEYPADRETVVNLTPTTILPNATGTARVLRTASGTTVRLDLSGLTGDVSNLNLYAVDSMGH